MLPPIDQGQLPPEVRDAGPRAREAYTAALGFEQILVQQLAEDMLDSVESEESDAAASLYREMLPGVLAEGIAVVGGLGLAPALYRSIAQGQAEGDGESGAADESVTEVDALTRDEGR